MGGESGEATEKPAMPAQAGPFYPDEIVWLYNEIGVVKLAQEDLYEARFAFDEADRFNREYVEFNDPKPQLATDHAQSDRRRH